MTQSDSKLTYIEDINRSSPNLNSVRAGNIKFSSLAKEKQLKYHPQKSCYLVYGPEDFKAKVELEALEEPVLLGKEVIHEKQEEKYLGDILSSQGLSASVRATVKDRTAKVKGAIYELRAVSEDVRMQAVGGFEAALDLYESCIVPSLLANCQLVWRKTRRPRRRSTPCRTCLGAPCSRFPSPPPSSVSGLPWGSSGAGGGFGSQRCCWCWP